MKLIALILFSLMTLCGCSAPEITPEHLTEEQIKQERTRQFSQAHQYQLKQRIRLFEVARPLLTKNTESCPKNQHYSLGVLFHRLADYPIEQRDAIAELYNLDEQLKVLYPLKGAPAENLLEVGDQLLSINQDKIIPEKASEQFKTLLKDGQPVTIELVRNGKQQQVTLQPELICSYPIILSSSDSINGFADGNRIIITAGLMRFTEQDNELALIIAHEMAHNTQNHIPQRLGNSAIGSLIDFVLISSGIPSPFVGAGLGANLHTQDYETEADIIGLKLMRKAGYEIEGMDDFWRRMATLHPQTITHGKQISHPTTVERALRIEKEIIRIKKAENLSTDSKPER